MRKPSYFDHRMISALRHRIRRCRGAIAGMQSSDPVAPAPPAFSSVETTPGDDRRITRLLAWLPVVDAPHRAGSAPYRFCQPARSEEHTSELQSLMRISYAVFCLKKKKIKHKIKLE